MKAKSRKTWSLVVKGRISIVTFVTKRDATRTLNMWRNIGVAGPNDRVVKVRMEEA